MTSLCVQVGDKYAVWAWLNDEVVPNLYFTEHYNGDVTTAYDEQFIYNGVGKRLGPPRLRQLRSKQGETRTLKDCHYLHCSVV